MNILNLIIRDIESSIEQLKFRYYFNSSGLLYPKTTLIKTPDVRRIKFGKNCTLGNYTIIDIVDFTDFHCKQKACIQLGDSVYIGDQCNIRASGNPISIGADSMIANNVVIVSANHQTALGFLLREQPWDKERGGVCIGKDCWIGSHSTILSGAKIGDGSIVASGAVVRGIIPPNEIWGGSSSEFYKKKKLNTLIISRKNKK